MMMILEILKMIKGLMQIQMWLKVTKNSKQTQQLTTIRMTMMTLVILKKNLNQLRNQAPKHLTLPHPPNTITPKTLPILPKITPKAKVSEATIMPMTVAMTMILVTLKSLAMSPPLLSLHSQPHNLHTWPLLTLPRCQGWSTHVRCGRCCMGAACLSGCRVVQMQRR